MIRSHWQALLVLLPVVLLSGLAVLSIRREGLVIRQQVEREASSAALRLADDLARDLDLGLRRAVALDPESGAWSDGGVDHAVIVMRTDAAGALRRPPPYDPVPRPGDPSPAYQRFRELVSGSEDPRGAAHPDIDSGNASSATLFEGLAEVRAENPDATTPSGIPLAPLIELERLRLLRVGRFGDAHHGDEAAGDPPPIDRLAAQRMAVVEAALTHPSSLTPTLLADALGPGVELERTLRRWDRDETARRLHAHLAAEFGPGPANDPISAWLRTPWVEWEGAWWLLQVEHDEADAFVVIVAESESDVRERVERIVADAATLVSAVPPYATPRVRFAGRDLARRPPPGDASEPLASATADRPPLPAVTVDLTFADPNALSGMVRARVRWLAGTVAVAALLAILGFVTIRRALLHERRLHAEKDSFVAAVSHELRTPVASIRLLAESLAARRVEDEPRRHRYYAIIGDECRRLGALIENILDLARFDSGGRAVDPREPADLNALAESVSERLRPLAEQRNVILRTDVPDAPVEAAVDSHAIARALVNLVDNAIKFAPDDSTITITVHAPDAKGTIRISVADEGEGIPAEEQKRIFDRFYRRGSELTRRHPGTGLGLSLVSEIARAHGGTVAVDSPPGRGATFTIILPKHIPS